MRNLSLNEQARAALDAPWREWLIERGYPPISLNDCDADTVSWAYRQDMDPALIPPEASNPDGMLKSVIEKKVSWSVGAKVVHANPLTEEERKYWVETVRGGAQRQAAPLPKEQDSERPKGALRRDY